MRKKLTISNVPQLNEKESVFNSLKDLKMEIPCPNQYNNPWQTALSYFL